MSDAISSQLENIITMLIAISITSERVVEIIKGYFPWLNLEKQDPVIEGKRKSALQLLAVVAGIVTAFLTQPFVAGSFSAFKHPDLMTLCIGLMASGGSAFWNAILNYLLQVKNLKKQQVNSVKADTVVDPLPPSPVYQDMVPGAEPVSSTPVSIRRVNNMVWRVAKSLLILRDQINQYAPHRNKASDGTIGDEHHAHTNSDHNPQVLDGNIGVVTAIDITHDPAQGCDAQAIVNALVDSKDKRIKYIIWNKHIISASVQPWVWRDYHGASPHDKHFHLSVVPVKALYDYTLPWLFFKPQTWK